MAMKNQLAKKLIEFFHIMTIVNSNITTMIGATALCIVIAAGQKPAANF